MCIAGGGLILPFHVAGSASERKEGFFSPKIRCSEGEKRALGTSTGPSSCTFLRAPQSGAATKPPGSRSEGRGGKKKKSHPKERKQHTRERRALVGSGQAGQRARTFSLD